MVMSISSGLEKRILESESLSDALCPFVLKLYSGKIPKNADSGLDGAHLMCSITVNGDGFTGLITVDNTDDYKRKGLRKAEKDDSIWKGNMIHDGPLEFFRLVKSGDTGLPDTNEDRIQGSVGRTEADLNITYPTRINDGAEVIIDIFTITVPKHNT